MSALQPLFRSPICLPCYCCAQCLRSFSEPAPAATSATPATPATPAPAAPAATYSAPASDVPGLYMPLRAPQGVGIRRA